MLDSPAPPAIGLRMLNDGPYEDMWLELMNRCGTFDELAAFFYDSFMEMMGHMGEFFSL